MRYAFYANGLQFDSHIADFTFFLYFLSGLCVAFAGWC